MWPTHIIHSLKYDKQSAFLTSPDIVRLEWGSAVRGINPSGCKTQVKLVRREATLNAACLNLNSFLIFPQTPAHTQRHSLAH